MQRGPRQLRLFKPANASFGGSLLRGSHPNTARPLNTKNPIHLVLKSEMATGANSMLAARNDLAIRRIFEKQAKKCRVRCYHYANGGNHLHLVIKIDSVRLFKKFLRSSTGLIARHVLKAQRNSAKLKAGKKFWLARPFTRIASWGRDYTRLCKYVTTNALEAIGFIVHQPRGRGSTAQRDEVITVAIGPEPE